MQSTRRNRRWPRLVLNDDGSPVQGAFVHARAKGAQVIEINPKGENFSQQPHHKMAPHIIIDPTDDMKVMQDEIFGPLLPVLPYQNLDAAIAYVNQHPRPLALYCFENDAGRRDRVLNETVAGGVTINDTILHIAQEELPFGGVGPSGMGHYHGIEGFKTFTKQKAVFYQSGLNGMSLFNPPYGALFERLTKFLIR